jgi:hypothetical protein
MSFSQLNVACSHSGPSPFELVWLLLYDRSTKGDAEVSESKRSVAWRAGSVNTAVPGRDARAGSNTTQALSASLRPKRWPFLPIVFMLIALFTSLAWIGFLAWAIGRMLGVGW